MGDQRSLNVWYRLCRDRVRGQATLLAQAYEPYLGTGCPFVIAVGSTPECAPINCDGPHTHGFTTKSDVHGKGEEGEGRSSIAKSTLWATGVSNGRRPLEEERDTAA